MDANNNCYCFTTVFTSSGIYVAVICVSVCVGRSVVVMLCLRWHTRWLIDFDAFTSATTRAEMAALQFPSFDLFIWTCLVRCGNSRMHTAINLQVRHAPNAFTHYFHFDGKRRVGECNGWQWCVFTLSLSFLLLKMFVSACLMHCHLHFEW